MRSAVASSGQKVVRPPLWSMLMIRNGMLVLLTGSSPPKARAAVFVQTSRIFTAPRWWAARSSSRSRNRS
ncbi:hypothetical protein BJF79_04505 [Actinomadura sp. CNU-125]|nr:hypothetical protein BJF79_04505 [Actinomadura sp. CNU-125]